MALLHHGEGYVTVTSTGYGPPWLNDEEPWDNVGGTGRFDYLNETYQEGGVKQGLPRGRLGHGARRFVGRGKGEGGAYDS